MKKVVLITVMLLVLVPSVRAELFEAQRGQFTYQRGLVLEYQVSPFDKRSFHHKGGRIGPVYGVDGGVPFTRLEKLILSRGKTRTVLEVSCMYNPAAGGRMEKEQFYVRVISPWSMILTGTFSDAAAGYAAQWLIVDGIGVRTLLSNDPKTVLRLIKP